MSSRKFSRSKYFSNFRIRKRKINETNHRINNTMKKLSSFVLFLMVIFILLTLFILFYTLNFTRLLKNTDSLISSKIDLAQQEMEHNFDSIKQIWMKILRNEKNYLAKKDLEEMKNLKNEIRLSKFEDLNHLINKLEKVFKKKHQYQKLKLDQDKIPQVLQNLIEDKVKVSDLLEYYENNKKKILQEGENLIEKFFDTKLKKSMMDSYMKEFTRIFDDTEKSVNSFEKKHLEDLEKSNWIQILEPFIKGHELFWKYFSQTQEEILNALYPKNYVYIQLEDQLAPTFLFTHFNMVQIEKDSHLVLSNFKTQNIGNAEANIYLWKK